MGLLIRLRKMMLLSYKTSNAKILCKLTNCTSEELIGLKITNEFYAYCVNPDEYDYFMR